MLAGRGVGVALMLKPANVVSLSPHQIQSAKEVYRTLCDSFLRDCPNNEYYDYIKSVIANDATLDRHVRAFELYAPYLSPGMRILDWGCRHAPDACLMRTLNLDLQLDGCDISNEDFAVFHQYAELNYQQLQHDYRLPYADQSFDVVLSSGVLEHVPLEYESVRELWRVIKTNGLLVVTFLPNKTALTENVSRWIGSSGCHNRLYGLTQTRDMFLRSGFLIERYGYHQVFPTFGKNLSPRASLNRLANLGVSMNRVAERIPFVNRISSNLFYILRRVRHT
jgi:ubiquinone/menaquinone biosynthesis C-methylase UbiE